MGESIFPTVRRIVIENLLWYFKYVQFRLLVGVGVGLDAATIEFRRTESNVRRTDAARSRRRGDRRDRCGR